VSRTASVPPRVTNAPMRTRSREAEAFLTMLTVAVRGVVQQFALDLASLGEPTIEELFALLAGSQRRRRR
jgi:hypothetical protein